jgi:hypothetical protein
MGKINTSITIDPRIAKLAKKYAALDDRSFANYVERAVAKQVEIDQNLEQPATKAAAPTTKTKAKRKA